MGKYMKARSILKLTSFGVGLAVLAGSALAKLPAPAPLDDAAKAKAAEAAAKTAWAGKVESFQLCRSMEKVAAHTQKNGKTKEPTATPACADPGAFVYTPVATATPAATSPAAPAVAAAAPAMAAAPAVAKKP
jgi:hypothetical protein